MASVNGWLATQAAKKEAPSWLLILNFVLILPSALVSWWAGAALWGLVFVPYGLPALTMWKVAAIRIAIRGVYPTPFQYHTDDRNEYQKAFYGFGSLILPIIAGPIAVWWVVPWLVGP